MSITCGRICKILPTSVRSAKILPTSFSGNWGPYIYIYICGNCVRWSIFGSNIVCVLNIVGFSGSCAIVAQVIIAEGGLSLNGVNKYAVLCKIVWLSLCMSLAQEQTTFFNEQPQCTKFQPCGSTGTLRGHFLRIPRVRYGFSVW